VIDSVDLHLQQEVGADLAANGAHDLEHEARALLPAAAVTSRLRNRSGSTISAALSEC
jgi:hypothetical protein